MARGTTFGLLGPNGAGKTTFVKMLLSSAHPTAGRATVFGRDSREPEARRCIGYLPENHRFPTYMTGAGMLDFYGALSGMDAASRRKRIPELLVTVGLETWGGVRLGKYSKGMLQRIGLAQALIHEPTLLILDEPSDGVDPIGRRQIRDILHALEQKGVTIFLNSHLLAEVELFCRDVAIIHRGKVALEGQSRISPPAADTAWKPSECPSSCSLNCGRRRKRWRRATAASSFFSPTEKKPTARWICCAPGSVKSKPWRAPTARWKTYS